MRRRINYVNNSEQIPGFDASVHTTHPILVADTLSRIGDLLYWEARKDPDLWKESKDEPNSLALSEVMKISQPAVWRLLHGVRTLRRSPNSNKPLDDYTPKAKTMVAIGRLIGKTDPVKILSAILNAPPRPPAVPRKKFKRRAGLSLRK